MTGEGQDDETEEEATIDRLAKKYTWRMPLSTEGKVSKAEAGALESKSMFERKTCS
jgi:hypothetical protein